jgi:ribose-phosphate pyrophosphokinase
LFSTTRSPRRARSSSCSSGCGRRGLGQISAAWTHGLFTGPAIERLKQEPDIAEIVPTNTVPLPPESQLPNMVKRSVAPLFAEAVHRIHMGESISSLFSDEPTYG